MNDKDHNGKFSKGNKGRKRGSKNKRSKSLTNLLEASLYNKVPAKDKNGEIIGTVEFGETLITILQQIILDKTISPQLRFNIIQWYFNRLEETPTQVVRHDTSNTAEAFRILNAVDKQIKDIDFEVVDNGADEKTN